MSLILVLVLTIILIWCLIGLYEKNTNVICKTRNMLHGKVAIVTGGTAGMGLEIAKDFAYRGAKVIIACPFEDEGMTARKNIIDRTGNDQIIFKLLDLASLKSVREFCKDVIETEDKLDILMNNAGVAVPGDFLTEDKLNFIMQVNYFGHFLMTILLIPLLKKAGKPSDPSRIINTTSIMHRYGAVDLDDLNRTGYYWFISKIYANSKYCLIPFTRELAKRLSDCNVVVNVVDPGAVGTRIFNSLGNLRGRFLTFFYRTLFKTPWEGAQTAIYVATDKKAGEVSGETFKNCRLTRAIQSAYDDKIAKKLWNESVRLVKLTDDEVKQCFL